MGPTIHKSPTRATNPERRARRQEQILEAATELFAQRSYSQTDTQVLIEQLGIGKGTLYRYFPSKRDLFLAAADRVMRKLRERVGTEIAGAPDPLDQIARAVRAFLAFFAENPQFVELLIQERAQFKDRKRPTYLEHCEANVERWRALYRGLISAGRIRDIPTERITDVVTDLLYGTIFTNYFAGQRKPPEEQAEDILDIVFHGILSEPERRARASH
jgi:AcrR family transcriptional regulator